jgi:uncharacterized glyoxalase superfamily protein PhnB
MGDKAPPMDMIRAMPVLEVRDVVASAAFYEEKLGFDSGKIFGDPPAFGIVARGTVTIAFDQSRDASRAPQNQYWAAYVYVADADALFAAYRAKGVGIVRDPEDTFYGCRDFDVRDLDGHLIAFGQDLVPSEAGPGL